MRLFSQQMLTELAARAGANPRQRAHHNIHPAPEDPVQRFFVCANRASYFRPHRHLTRSEMTIVIRGAFTVLTFDHDGTVTGRHEVGEHAPNLGFETPRATWHTLVAMADGSTFLEIKEGPYDPSVAAEFAPWAPVEGDPRVRAFVAWLRNAQPGLAPPR